jgi:Glycosyltransferase family 87
VRFPGQRLRTVAWRLGEWLLPVVLGTYVLYATIDWEVPQPGGIRFGPLWLGVTLAAGIGWIAAGRRLGAIAMTALASIAAMVLTDITFIVGQNLRDLHLYLHAGRHFLDGEPVYLDRLFTVRPVDLSNFPFLYPPPTLPVFAILSLLPQLLVDVGWVAASIAAGVFLLRLIGIRGWWTFVFLAWPPLFQGIEVGNVSIFAGLLFALAPWLGAGLVVAAVFKLYSGIAALWLVRERRALGLVTGIAVVVGAALVTLPLTGIDRWHEWLVGLDWYRASQPLLPGSLYGFGLARYLRFLPFVAVAVLVTVVALRSRGREGLARLGLATVVASPSLYAHGLMVAVPALLLLEARWMWLALGIMSVAPGIGWWAGIGLTVVAWVVPVLRRTGSAGEEGVNVDDDALHPLRRGAGPWPTAETRPVLDRAAR